MVDPPLVNIILSPPSSHDITTSTSTTLIWDKHHTSYLKDYVRSHIQNPSPCPNALLVSIEEPQTYEIAVKHTHWKIVMQDEIDALH